MADALSPAGIPPCDAWLIAVPVPFAAPATVGSLNGLVQVSHNGFSGCLWVLMFIGVDLFFFGGAGIC